MSNKLNILIVGLEQEISSFNPVESEYEDFSITYGSDIIKKQTNADTCINGALSVFKQHKNVNVTALYAAKACSAGALSIKAYYRLLSEILESIKNSKKNIDGIYLSLHGAMGSVIEDDPEGFLLENIKKILSKNVKVVLSLDLHAVLTEKMILNCDAFTAYKTYPHEDFIDTGKRASKLLINILEKNISTCKKVVNIPALVRGPELNTTRGIYGKLLNKFTDYENKKEILSTGILIGNPFSDSTELGCKAFIITSTNNEKDNEILSEIAIEFWNARKLMVENVTNINFAFSSIKNKKGNFTFTDAADSPSSGATGDSNFIIKSLLEYGYKGKTIIPIVDADLVTKAHKFGIGRKIKSKIGGTLDPKRFKPIILDLYIEKITEGGFIQENTNLPADSGKTALLVSNNIKIIAVSKPMMMQDRSIYISHDQNLNEFDLIVLKSPGAYMRYFKFAKDNFVIDSPGATPANVKKLKYSKCKRPIWPIDDVNLFKPCIKIII